MRLRKREFEKWLRAKRPDEIVGVPGDCSCCPLATYHRDAGDGEVVIAWKAGRITIDRGGGERAAPAWAETFAYAVDRENGKGITAARALELLAASD